MQSAVSRKPRASASGSLGTCRIYPSSIGGPLVTVNTTRPSSPFDNDPQMILPALYT
jgi:hypothetical protein